MKKIKIGNPEWLQEIINKKEYLELAKRDLFFNNHDGTVEKIDFSKISHNIPNKFICKLIDDKHFHFNFSTGEIIMT